MTKLVNNIDKFIFAGNAIFTLESSRSGKRYTYRIRQCQDNKRLFFVSLLRGPDNISDYTYLGIIVNNTFKLTKKSKYTFETPAIKVFNFFFQKRHKLDKVGLNIYHEGRCGKCGRKLTTPQSIKAGLGPVCINL